MLEAGTEEGGRSGILQRAEDTARALEAQRLIREMAEHEERLMKSLRETQAAQTQAFEDLQSTLKL